MMTALRLFLLALFLGLPLIEIAVLIKVGQWIGFWPTLGLLVLSATVGLLVIRQQGVSMVGRMFDTMNRGGLLVVSMVDSYATILAGCLLIVPGFISDAVGLALLVPPLRRLALGAVLPGFAQARRRHAGRAADLARPAEPAPPIVIEGTYERLDEDDPKR
jgi:UPF0716 protein FxsA